MNNDNLIAFQPPETAAPVSDALSDLVRQGARLLFKHSTTVKIVGSFTLTTTVNRQLTPTSRSKYSSLFYPSTALWTAKAIRMKMLHDPLSAACSIS